MAAVGNPQRAFRSIHVAGTKGKGSTAAMAQSILTAAGYRTGLYTSPHLSPDRGADDRGRRDDAGGGVRSRSSTSWRRTPCRQRDERPNESPTFFELVTAAGFRHFARRGAELAVVEVGMGGRLDATNIIRPEVSVITRVDYDHEERLGHTLDRIAFEKAGIIKPGVPVVCAPQEPEALAVVAETARAARLALRADRRGLPGRERADRAGRAEGAVLPVRPGRARRSAPRAGAPHARRAPGDERGVRGGGGGAPRGTVRAEGRPGGGAARAGFGAQPGAAGGLRRGADGAPRRRAQPDLDAGAVRGARRRVRGRAAGAADGRLARQERGGDFQARPAAGGGGGLHAVGQPARGGAAGAGGTGARPLRRPRGNLRRRAPGARPRPRRWRGRTTCSASPARSSWRACSGRRCWPARRCEADRR